MTAAVVAVCAVAGLGVGLGLEVVVEQVHRRAPMTAWVRDDLHPARAAVLTSLTVALFAGLALRYDDSWVLPAFLVVTAGLIALSVIDFEHFLLPNRIVYPLAVATVALLVVAAVGDGAWDTFGRALLGGVAATVALGVLHLVSPRSMGFGDVKLAFVLGLVLRWLGWEELVLGLFCGFLAGAVVGVALIVIRHRGRKDHLPFGPFLAFGTLVVLLWGDAVLRWYRV